jgi:hypothetical protein
MVASTKESRPDRILAVVCNHETKGRAVGPLIKLELRIIGAARLRVRHQCVTAAVSYYKVTEKLNCLCQWFDHLK